jgi:hypothetical protein
MGGLVASPLRYAASAAAVKPVLIPARPERIKPVTGASFFTTRSTLWDAATWQNIH